MRRMLPAVVAVVVIAAACGDTVSEEVGAVAEPTNTEGGEDSSVTTSSETAEASATTDASEPADASAATGVPEPTTSTTAEPKPPSTTTAPPTDPPATVEEPVAAQGMVDIAKADLAIRLSVAMSDIGVVSIEEVTWRDGSLGCPRPGFSYTQALVNGTRILLTANGVTYHYHSGGGDPFYCANPQDPLPPGGGDYGDV